MHQEVNVARYEGMDDLLEQVRKHLQADAGSIRSPKPARQPDVASCDESYQTALEHMLLLLRDAEQLRAHLTPGNLSTLSLEQFGDLQKHLFRVLQELYSCDTALQHFAPGD